MGLWEWRLSEEDLADDATTRRRVPQAAVPRGTPNPFMASLVKGRTAELRRILDLLFVWLERSANRIHRRRRQAFGSGQRPRQRRQTHLRGRSSEPCGRSTVTTACHHRHATRKSCVCPDRRQSWGSRAPSEDGPSYGSTSIQGPLPRNDPFRIPQRKQSSATARGANQTDRGRAHWRSGTSRCGLDPEGSSQEKGLRERRAAHGRPS